MTLSEFVEAEAIGRMIYPAGVPATLRPPNISTERNAYGNDIPDCQLEVFLPMAANAPAIELMAVFSRYPCLTILDVDEALVWTPVWMCASIYAFRAEVEYAGEVTFTTSWKLARQLWAGRFLVSREAILEFYRQTGDNIDSDLREAMVEVLGFDVETETQGWWDEQD